ncbi:tail fiber protein, partial [Salmonella enterica subsp. enterica serovar Corvallis]
VAKSGKKYRSDDTEAIRKNLGLNETLNPSKRVSIGTLGTGPFDGSKPAINIGDSDSGFVFESDGVIGVYANSQKIAELTNTEFKIIGNASLVNGALLLGGLTHFLRHTAADDAGFGGNNVEIGSWNGIGLTCTYDCTTRIYFNTRTGEIGLRGDLKADGNVRSGNAWLDQTGNLQGSAWGTGIGLKAYLENTFNKKNTASLDTNGWHRDESTGLITQWGLIAGANGTYNFPRGFPNQCFAVLVTNTSAQGSGVDNAFGYPLSNSQFFASNKNDGGNVNPYPVAFMAFGR